jgi:hypothetical protein
VATVGNWILGAVAGANTMTATSAGLGGSPVTFNATGGATTSNFNIDLRFLGGGTPSQQAAFTAAAVRWQQVIIGDIPANAITPLVNDTTCTSDGLPNPTPLNVSGTVDDVVIFADLRAIDGVGNILGAAGPCYIRSVAQNEHTIVGYMKFDTADLPGLEAGGDLTDVAFHEMGHVLGYGTLWDRSPKFLLSGGSTANPFFNGSAARAAFLTEGGATTITPSGNGCSSSPVAENFARTTVPVENTGGGGTALSHWEECVFFSEVMTGYISGTVRPFSLTSLQSMADLGYQVNPAAADPFNLATQPSLRVPDGSRVIDLHDDILRAPISVVDAQGRVIGVVPK